MMSSTMFRLAKLCYAEVVKVVLLVKTNNIIFNIQSETFFNKATILKFLYDIDSRSKN